MSAVAELFQRRKALAAAAETRARERCVSTSPSITWTPVSRVYVWERCTCTCGQTSLSPAGLFLKEFSSDGLSTRKTRQSNLTVGNDLPSEVETIATTTLFCTACTEL